MGRYLTYISLQSTCFQVPVPLQIHSGKQQWWLKRLGPSHPCGGMLAPDFCLAHPLPSWVFKKWVHGRDLTLSALRVNNKHTQIFKNLLEEIHTRRSLSHVVVGQKNQERSETTVETQSAAWPGAGEAGAFSTVGTDTWCGCGGGTLLMGITCPCKSWILTTFWNLLAHKKYVPSVF